MTDSLDSGKRVAAELIALARRDAPPPGSLERELARRLGGAAAGPAITRASWPAKTLAASGLVLAIAGALALVFHTEDARTIPPASTVTAAPPRAALSTTAHAETSAQGVSIDSLPEASAPPKAGTSLAPGTPAQDTHATSAHDPTLAEELARLRRARAMAASRPTEALALLDAHAADFPKTTFREEATVIRVEALLASGQRPEAERLAAPLLRDKAEAPVGQRLRDLLRTGDRDQ